MTYKYKCVILLQLVVYFSIICAVQYQSHQYHTNQYYSDSHNYYGRTHWKHFTKNRPASLNKVKIALYYETLCPASVNYLMNVLRPAVEKLGPYLDLHLVPYGNAQTTFSHKGVRFKCQHGVPECYGNRIHACAIGVIRNNTKSTLFNACLMENTAYREQIGHDFATALTTCCKKMNVSSEGIWQCVNSRRGTVLLKRYGEETHHLTFFEYVPYVLINGKENADNEDLVTVICSKLNPLPTACPRRRRTNYNRTWSSNS